MENIAVNYEYTNNSYKAKKWLSSLPSLIAVDFETASKFTSKQKQIIKCRLDNHKNISPERQRILLQQLLSNGFSHPSLSLITHLSVAWSDRDSFVIVCDSDSLRNLVFHWLVGTSNTQIWHNSLFDFKHIYYNTGKLPKDYIDTLLLARSLLNNANPFFDRVGLKELMGYAYGAWSLEKKADNYTLEDMWNPEMLKYTATDSPATFKLYQDLLEELGGKV